MSVDSLIEYQNQRLDESLKLRTRAQNITLIEDDYSSLIQQEYDYLADSFDIPAHAWTADMEDQSRTANLGASYMDLFNRDYMDKTVGPSKQAAAGKQRVNMYLFNSLEYKLLRSDFMNKLNFGAFRFGKFLFFKYLSLK